MTTRKVGISVVVMASVLTPSGGMAYSGELMPLPPVPADYADKHMPAGWWTDPKVIEEGRQIYSGEVNQLVNCRSCHKDGQPVKSGGGLRDQKNTPPFLRQLLVLASGGRGSKDDNEGLEVVPVRRADLAGDRVRASVLTWG